MIVVVIVPESVEQPLGVTERCQLWQEETSSFVRLLKGLSHQANQQLNFKIHATPQARQFTTSATSSSNAAITLVITIPEATADQLKGFLESKGSLL